jgi:hypothetical protein
LSKRKTPDMRWAIGYPLLGIVSMKHSLMLSAVFSCLALADLAFAQDLDLNPQVEDGSRFSSARFNARFVGDGFSITDKEKEGEAVHVLSMPPVYRAAWTGDGQTLATIEHVAGGCDFACFHFDAVAGEWFRMNVVPAGTYRWYRVNNWNVGRDSVTLSYEVQAENNKGINKSVVGPLRIDQSVFRRFVQSFTGQKNRKVLAGVVELSASGTFRRVPSDGSMHGSGILAIDLDGSGSSHQEPSPPHQAWTSAMKDASGKFRWRHVPLPNGCKELNADEDCYGVAPKNFATVNGGSLEPDGQMEVVPANQKRDVIQIGDFGPDNKYGEVAYAEIGPLGYKIKETSHGPYPWDGSNSKNIPVDVTCHP